MCQIGDVWVSSGNGGHKGKDGEAKQRDREQARDRDSKRTIGRRASWPAVEMAATAARPTNDASSETTRIGKRVTPTRHILAIVSGVYLIGRIEKGLTVTGTARCMALGPERENCGGDGIVIACSAWLRSRGLLSELLVGISIMRGAWRREERRSKQSTARRREMIK